VFTQKDGKQAKSVQNKRKRGVVRIGPGCTKRGVLPLPKNYRRRKVRKAQKGSDFTEKKEAGVNQNKSRKRSKFFCGVGTEKKNEVKIRSTIPKGKEGLRNKMLGYQKREQRPEIRGGFGEKERLNKRC